MAGTNPRAVRIAALIQRVIASSIESQLHDQRLQGVTITDVRVTNDLQIAHVFWTQLGQSGHEQGERKRAQQALNQAKGRLRSLVGSKAGLRLTPQLRFEFDEVPREATEIEDILVAARRRDVELERLRSTASYAGEEDPYRHDDDDDDDDDDSAEDADDAEVDAAHDESETPTYVESIGDVDSDGDGTDTGTDAESAHVDEESEKTGN
ncbi:MAG: 30S ribosome-binding factor RbfA [Bifidobacterium sp.]|uniref:30S ribosome-binding factor RbfA n=1 Tax=Bifidobacterium sp. TaxID=41200 RepID=UPI0039E78207